MENAVNVYHCLIELRPEARALSFAHAVGLWLDHLAKLELVSGWRLMRRKFGLASGRHTDFVLEIEIEGMAALDDAFTAWPTVTTTRSSFTKRCTP
jgi:hypothetical protein